ncbi:MAG: glycerate kinase, partial [Psychrobacter sp.]
ATRLSAHIAKADLVITGEGKLDAQTMMGKVANGVGLMAKAQNKPVIAICGAVDHEDYHKSAHNESAMNTLFAVVMPSIQQLAPIDEVFNSAYSNIETTALNLAAAMRLGEKLN